MKRDLCEAFCSEMHVERVPAGWAVQTPYRLPDGDPIMFFIMRTKDGVSRLEDDGATIAGLEMQGASMDAKGSRYEAFRNLLAAHEADFDADEGVIRTADMPDGDIPGAAVKFMALMLRVHDLTLLSTERVMQTWRDDAMADLHKRFDPVATVEENALAVPGRGALQADAVIRQGDAPPVAVVMATSNAKGLQALVLKMELEKYQGQDVAVVLLLERAKDNPLNEPTYALAQSRLDGVHTYRGAELDAMTAIAKHVQPQYARLQ